MTKEDKTVSAYINKINLYKQLLAEMNGLALCVQNILHKK